MPAAATTLDARAVLVLFNPFPDDAVLEVEFVTADGVRIPAGYEGLPVPGQSVVAARAAALIAWAASRHGDRIGGVSGCNRYSGSVVAGEAPGALSVEQPLASTRMACPEPLMEAELRRLAATDDLTGLFNRRRFIELLPISRSLHTNHPAAGPFPPGAHL